MSNSPRTKALLRFSIRLLAMLVAAAAIWLFALNRVLIQMPDGHSKTFTVVASLLLALAGALVLARSAKGPWLAIALGVTAVALLGEGRRLWLRHQYGATLPDSDVSLLSSPVTTTALTVRRFEQALVPTLPERVRAVQLSDLHVSDSLPASYFTSLHEAISALAPDLLLMTGDFLSKSERLPLLRRWLAHLPETRYGRFAVLGNHDYWIGDPEAVRAALRAAGVNVVSGECAPVELDTGTLRVCGTEAPWGRKLEALPDDPGVLATLVLSHTPDNVYALSELGADVVFSGHTHGGQIRMPVLGALVVPSRYGRRFDLGRFDVGGTRLFVSAGVGADSPPLRLWCPPDLVVVDFR